MLIDNLPIAERNIITVVIPTLNKSDPKLFNITLNELNNSRLVDEVLIVDNSVDKGFKDMAWEKVRHIKDQPNLWVNGAWNWGVAQAKTSYVLLLNDDVILDKSVLVECVNAIAEYDCIVIDTGKEGLSEYMVNVPRHNKKVNVIDCKLAHEGSFILVKREKYVIIPAELKIFFGDYWLFERMRLGKVLSTYVNHLGQTTVNKENRYDDGTLAREREIYQQLRGANGKS